MHQRIVGTVVTALLALAAGSAYADKAYDDATMQAKHDSNEPAVKAWLASPKVVEATRKRAASAVERCFKGAPNGLGAVGITYLLSKGGKVAKVFTGQSSPTATCVNQEFSSLELPAPPRSVYVKYVDVR